MSTTQPLRGDELRVINAWLKERARLNPAGRTIFISWQRKPLHRSTVNLALRKYSAVASVEAGRMPRSIPVRVHYKSFRSCTDKVKWVAGYERKVRPR